MFFLIGIFALLTCCYIVSYLKKERNLSAKHVPPGPIRFPVLGNFGQILLKKDRKLPFLMYQKMCKEYKTSTLFLRLGVSYQVVLEDYETIRELLCSEIWVDRFYSDWTAERAFGKKLGVLTVSGNVWKEMRRFSLRTLRDFGFGKQKSMNDTIQQELADLIAGLDHKISSSNNPNNKGYVLEMKQFFTISILNILWNMIAGFRFEHSDERLKELINLIDQVLKENAIGGSIAALYIAFPILTKIIPRITSQGRNRHKLTNGFHRFFRAFLEQRRAEGTYREDMRDFIDVFLNEIDNHKHLGNDETINHYTDEQFLVVARDLFMAGSETTSNTMEFAILYMLLNPEIQSRVQAEIDSVVGTNRFPNVLDRPNMPYTEAVLLEVQRISNVVPLVIRSPSQATTIGPYHIPEGTIGIINLFSMHMNDKEWPEPFKFNPSRFFDESTRSVINAHRILPFGVGKRICLGEVLAKTTLFTYFTTFLQQYTFSNVPGEQMPSIEPEVGLTMSPKPYRILVSQRI